LDEARLEPGEVPDLQQERERLANAQSLQALAARGVAQLYEEEGSVVELIGKLQRDAENWSRLDAELEEVVHRLEGLQADVQDVANALRPLEQGWEAAPARLDEVERRLQSLRRLEAKYGKKVDELIIYRLTLDEREQQLQQQEDDLGAIQAE